VTTDLIFDAVFIGVK
jgi:hypothetical protein